MIKVYHRKPWDCRAERPVREEELELVAEIETDDLSDAFEATQHLDTTPWWDTPGVKCYAPSRSTMVGDILEYPDRVRFMVMPVGFHQIDHAPRKRKESTCPVVTSISS